MAALLTDLGYPHDARQAAERLAAWRADTEGTVLVAEGAGAVGGLVAVHRVPYFERPGAFARIVALSVRRDSRRGGVGRQLVAAAEAWAQSRGCTDLEVTSARAREAAHRFYPALGYADQCGRAARYTRALDPDAPV